MKLINVNDLKRHHNALFTDGQELMTKVNEVYEQVIALRKRIKEIEGDEYDPIPLIFGDGFWIGDEEEK